MFPGGAPIHVEVTPQGKTTYIIKYINSIRCISHSKTTLIPMLGIYSLIGSN